MNRKLLACAFGLSVVVLAGCGGGGGEKDESQTSAPATSETTAAQEEQTATASAEKGKGNPENGKKLYLSTCATCHGDKGDGKGPAGMGLTPPPRNFTDHKAMSTITDEQMFKAIRGGGAAVGKSPVMPAQPQFTDQQILDIVAYERAFEKK